MRSAAHRRADARRFLEIARERLLGKDIAGLRVLGPVDAPMARRAGHYRAQLLLQSRNRQALHAVLKDQFQWDERRFDNQIAQKPENRERE